MLTSCTTTLTAFCDHVAAGEGSSSESGRSEQNKE